MLRSQRWPAVAMLMSVSIAACSGGSESTTVPSAATREEVTASGTTGPPATTPAVTQLTASGSTTAPAVPTGLVRGLESGGLDGLADELAELRTENDGRLPLDASLDLFAATLGPMPGGDPARFTVASDTVDGDGVEGTLAARAVLARWDELTPGFAIRRTQFLVHCKSPWVIRYGMVVRVKIVCRTTSALPEPPVLREVTR